MVKREILLIIFLIVFLPIVSSQELEYTHVISNSEDWKDVYSVLHYATLNGLGSSFLVSPRHGTLLLYEIDKNTDIRVISSRRSPYVLNYDDQIRSAGYRDADEIVVDSANLELINEIENLDDFIIVGSDYGYNAIAVVPYAVKTRSWVFFADRSNIDDIEVILSNRNVDNVMIYGFVDREVKDALETYEPEIINSGDKFKDNVEIVKKFRGLGAFDQVTLSNGEFIEKGLMTGTEPILFTGKQNVPDQVRDYLSTSDIKVAVLVGGDLVGAATNIRRSTGVSVIVKFARGARAPTGSIAAVEGLDLFYLPIPILELELYSAKYNRATSQLEITYHSNSNVPVFLKGTITPKDGERIGDLDPIFVAPDDYKTITYPDVNFEEGNYEIEVFTLFGEGPSSLDRILEGTFKVDISDVIDRCEIEIEGLKYKKSKDEFEITIKNKGEVDCYADGELLNVLIDGTETTLGAESTKNIAKGKKGHLIIEQEMTEEDLDDNEFVDVIVYYGEREDSLVKSIKGRFELGIEFLSAATIGLIVLVIAILFAILILFIIFWRRRKDDDF